MGWKDTLKKLKSKNSIVNLEITISGSFCLHRNIITIAVFYALPVIQLVITYQTVSAASDPQIPAFTEQRKTFAVIYRERYKELCPRINFSFRFPQDFPIGSSLSFKSSSPMFYHRPLVLLCLPV